MTSLQSPALGVSTARQDSRSERDRLWEHGRNSLRIARLLASDDRPAALVETACHLALESTCRAALKQVGLAYDGSVERSLARLAAPANLLAPEAGPASRVRATERAIEWLAAFLRTEAPERAWGL